MTYSKKKKLDFDLSKHDIVLPPKSSNLEMSVLGLILYMPEYYLRGRRYLTAEGMFQDTMCAKLWDAIVLVHDKGTPYSLEPIIAQFELRSDREMIPFTYTVAASWCQPTEFIKLCLKLNEFWIQRRLFVFGYNINQNALSSEFDPLELLGEASEGLGKIFLHIGGMKETTMADGIETLSEQIVELSKNPGGLLGLPSSLSGINNVIKGYRKGNLIVIGGSTHEGKTTLALQDARSLAESDIPTGYITLEMGQYELLMLMACDATGIGTEKVLTGTMNEEEMKRYGNYMNKLKKLPIYFSDKPGMRIGEAKAIARNWVKNKGVQAVFIDHMHLVYDDTDQNNAEQRFTNVANKCKEMAKELDIPVIALAQLSRKDKTEAKRPHVVTDLKYAGGIEQAADVIMLIYRPEVHGIEFDPNGKSTAGMAKIFIPKLRLLKKTDVRCHFTGLRFNDEDMFNEPFAPHDNPRAAIRSVLPTEKEEAPF